MKIGEAAAWGTVATLLIGGSIAAYQEFAHAGDVAKQFSSERLNTEVKLVTNRIEQLKREKDRIHRRRLNGQKFPDDDVLLAEILEELRIEREHRTELRKLMATK